MAATGNFAIFDTKPFKPARYMVETGFPRAVQRIKDLGI